MKHGETETHFEGAWYEHPILRDVMLAALLAGPAFLLAHTGHLPKLIETALFLVAIVLGGRHWMAEAVEELVEEREVGIEFLMMAATAGSALLGLWDEAAALVILYGAAEGLEEYVFARTRASIRALLDLAPKTARVSRDGREESIPAESLRVGDVFIVKPGEAMPTDGVVLKGASSVNQAPITGESVPVEKTQGSAVFAASINQDGILEVEATATFADNTLAKMVHMVEEAREHKGQTQLFIESFGRRYSPAVLATAVLLLILPPLLGGSWSEWARRAIVLLVAAAPCALVMSTPVAVAAGIGTAGKRGILIKGGAHLENLGKIRVVALDKTGTITFGKPVVSEVLALQGDRERALGVAASLELASTHPLARAVVEAARRAGSVPPQAEEFRALAGSGVRARVDGELYYLGSPKLFESLGVTNGHGEDIRRLEEEGKTVVLLGTAESLHGIIAIQDKIRPEARRAVEELHRLGLRTAILTGDNERTALAIGKLAGIDDVRADLKPEEKLAAVEQLTRTYGPIAMVGDGINDAPALARAAVGIAMGAAGTDAAIEAADVALMGDDLTKLVEAVRLGRAALRIGRQNIVFSVAVLAALVPAAILGVMTVAVAVVLHEASELLAVANGLRLTRQSRT
jgi:Cd2+/Zn2+-exporting ATPase